MSIGRFGLGNIDANTSSGPIGAGIADDQAITNPAGGIFS